jgi:hypothetical protein
MSKVAPGNDPDAERSEVLSSGDPDATRSRRWFLPVGALALAGLAAVSLIARSAHPPVPRPTPTSSITGTTEPAANFAPLPVAEGNPYFRSAPNNGMSIVAFLLTDNSPQPITLSSVQVTGANMQMAAAIVPIDSVRRLMLESGSVESFSSQVEGRTIQVTQGKSAGLVIWVEPNCAVRSPPPTVVVTVVGSIRSPTGYAPASYTLPEPLDGSSSPTWLQQGVAAACTPQAPSQSGQVEVVEQEFGGLRLTTSGPRYPPGSEPFTVTLTATNVTNAPYRGGLGVCVTDRIRGNGLAQPVGPDALDTRTNLTAWGSFGFPAPAGTTSVTLGAVLKDETIGPGATLTLTFYLDAARIQELLGPTRGWIPVLWPNGSPSAAQPDSSHYPIIVLAR